MITREQRAVASVFAALVAAVVVPPAAQLGYRFDCITAIAVLAAAVPLARLVPIELGGAARRHPWLSLAWTLIALLACAQMARLSAFMADESKTWGSTIPDAMVVHHACLGAYVEAAALTEQHAANLYDEQWYPAYQGACGRPGSLLGVRKLGAWVSDPYLYPPPFLLVPRLVLTVTHDIDRVRTIWFVGHGLLLIGGMVALARWVGSGPGRSWLLLVPATLASPPTMLMLQFGQVHGLAVLAALGGMAAFESAAPALGGALLAAAVLTKLTPAVLLLPLLAARRWRALGWTVGYAAAFTAVAMLWLGVEPFRSFLHYQLPRLITGEAFSFLDRQDSVFLVSRNFSIQGLGARLRLLGFAGGNAGAFRGLATIVLATVCWLAWHTRRTDASRAARMATWLSVLNLAVLCSPVAPSAYVTVPALWLVALLSGAETRPRWWPAAMVAGWMLIVGTPPLPDRLDLIIAGLGQASMIGLCVWTMLPGWSGRPRGLASGSRRPEYLCVT